MNFSPRRLAEFASRRVTFRAHLPKRFGRRPIYVSPANQLSIWKPGDAKFQKYLLDFAERFVAPGDVVWDIGSNMGMFGVPAAHRARFTLAVEPDPFNQMLLHRTRSANPDLVIEVLPAAVSNKLAVADFAIPERGRSANALADAVLGSQMGGTRQMYKVMTVTADWMLDHFPAPDFVKIDAEGAEAMILEGAPKLLAGPRPAIIIEMPNENADACAAHFKKNDYFMCSAYQSVDQAKEIEDIHDVWDVLAIPREKIEHFAGK